MVCGQSSHTRERERDHRRSGAPRRPAPAAAGRSARPVCRGVACGLPCQRPSVRPGCAQRQSVLPLCGAAGYCHPFVLQMQGPSSYLLPPEKLGAYHQPCLDCCYGFSGGFLALQWTVRGVQAYPPFFAQCPRLAPSVQVCFADTILSSLQALVERVRPPYSAAARSTGLCRRAAGARCTSCQSVRYHDKGPCQVVDPAS